MEPRRDGRLVARPDFTIGDAKNMILEKGYSIVGEPVAVKRHFEALATKQGKYFDRSL